jgi:hypothetical protein
MTFDPTQKAPGGGVGPPQSVHFEIRRTSTGFTAHTQLISSQLTVRLCPNADHTDSRMGKVGAAFVFHLGAEQAYVRYRTGYAAVNSWAPAARQGCEAMARGERLRLWTNRMSWTGTPPGGLQGLSRR